MIWRRKKNEEIPALGTKWDRKRTRDYKSNSNSDSSSINKLKVQWPGLLFVVRDFSFLSFILFTFVYVYAYEQASVWVYVSYCSVVCVRPCALVLIHVHMSSSVLWMYRFTSLHMLLIFTIFYSIVLFFLSFFLYCIWIRSVSSCLSCCPADLYVWRFFSLWGVCA